ncbi:DUF222 domain-containing protein [Auraticoccus sp. F435]|uniref:DUF222 domain-containing protein n=1 Tax=Auraticoccus cholistanensis TaxID=2656650 RepID=A0A6A9URH1_9ACTN|nr:HNH endonuclease signature motif containing protein [Auraticoccus cholistanensis]MVA75271.1 DUF222 domain-containing protein [Auraticoccus cholistanensis]
MAAGADTATTQGVGEVTGALDGLAAAVDAVLAAGDAASLARLDDDTVVGLLRRLEQVRNRVAVAESAVLTEAAARELPERHCQRRTSTWLARLLRLSPGEAARRVAAADALSPRTTTTGEPLPPLRAELAAARSDGSISAEHTQVVLTALDRLERRVLDPEVVTRAECTLTRYAREFDPPRLRQIADHLLEVVDPDGAVPDDESQQRRRFLRLRQRRDSMWAGEFELTAACGAKLRTVLQSLAGDRSARLVRGDAAGVGRSGEGGEPGGDAGEPLVDTRDHGQRMADALDEACDLLLRAGALPASGGTPATVVVTCTEEQLRTRTGLARLADGSALPVRDLSQLAGGADVWAAVVDGAGVPLRLGRSRRLASPAQTVALIARDGGCSFPGCDRAPQWCERHHVTEWSHGGPTDLSNLTLLCRYHHRHHLGRGWQVRIGEDGLPQWTPPSWVDPRREPLVHHRILARRTHGTPAPPPPPVCPPQQQPPGSGRGPHEGPGTATDEDWAAWLAHLVDVEPPEDDWAGGPDPSDDDLPTAGAVDWDAAWVELSGGRT